MRAVRVRVVCVALWRVAFERCTRSKRLDAVPCPSGTFAPLVGAVSCAVCIAGTRSEARSGSAQCVPCSAVEFSVRGSSLCAPLGVVAVDGRGTCALQPGGLRLCWPRSPGPFDGASYVSMCRECGVVADTGALECVGGTLAGTFVFVTCDSVAGVACAVTGNGSAVVCFVPTTMAPLPSGPHMLPAAASFVACGGVLSAVCCALLSDGSVVCWAVTPGASALGPPGGTRPLAALAVGVTEACGALMEGGAVVCWSLDSSTRAQPLWGNFTSLCASSGGWCGISVGGFLQCRGDALSETAPSVATLPALGVACGPAHVCALDSTRRLECAGQVSEPPVCPSPSIGMAPNRCVAVVAVAADGGRAPGIGPGDTVTLAWSHPFALPVCNPDWRSVSSTLGGSPVVFVPPLGSLDGRGRWVDGRTFVVTLTAADGYDLSNVDLAATRIGVVSVSLMSSPCPDDVNVTSDAVLISGTWGAMPVPRVISAIASDSGDGLGLNEGDSVVVRFDARTDMPEIAYASGGGVWSWVDGRVELDSIGINGEWLNATTLAVVLSGPSLLSLEARIGDIAVTVAVHSMDESSPASAQVVPVMGTFGNAVVDVKGPPALSTRGGELVVLTLAVAVGHMFNLGSVYGFYANELWQHVATGCEIRSSVTVVCRTVPGVGANFVWHLSGAGTDGVGRGPRTRSAYEAPVLLDLSVIGQLFTDTDGGGVLVLNGSGFGASTADVDGVVCTPSAALQESSVATGCVVTVQHAGVQCVAPPLRGSSGVCVLSVGGQRTGLAAILSTALPVITGVALVQWNTTCGSNVTLCAQGGDTVLMTGENFGPVVDGVFVSCGGSYARECSLYVPHSAVLCVTPAGGGARLAWTISIMGVVSAPFVALSYSPPEILSFVPLPGAGADTAGFTARVTCANCYKPRVLFDGVVLAAVQDAGSWLVNVPRGAGGGHSCIVVSENQASEAVAVSYAPPVIVALDIVAVSASTYQVKITGTSLGGVLAWVQVALSGQPCQVVVVSHTSVMFWAPTSAGTVVVSVAGLSSPPIHFDALAPQARPYVARWHSASLSLDVGGTVRVDGVALRASLPGVTRVVLAPCDCESSAGWRDACTALAVADDGLSLECTLPPSASATVELAVVKLVNGACAALPAAVSVRYDPPVCTGSVPGALRTHGGEVLAISGVNFEAGTMVSVGGDPCPVVSRSPRRIMCTTPAGGGAVVSLVLSSPTYGSSAATALLAYAPPVVASVTPAMVPAIGGSVTLWGTDFGERAITRVFVDGVAAVLRSVAWNWTNVLVPVGVGVGKSVIIDVAGQTVLAGSVSYAPPSVTSLREIFLDASAGEVFHVNGVNFGPPPGARINVTVNHVNCSGVIVSDDGELSAVLPAFQVVAYAASVVVTVAGQASRVVTVPVLCPAGLYAAAGALCVPCPAHAMCYGGRIDPIAAFGYYAMPAAGGRVYVPCQPPNSCLLLPPPSLPETASGVVVSWAEWAVAGNETSNCAAPAYTGPGCSLCGGGFYRKLGECIPCSGFAGLYLALFLIGAAAAVLLLTWAYQRRAQLKGVTVGIDFAQVGRGCACVCARLLLTLERVDACTLR